ncbi:hypothetical protein SAY86_001149 [Trapa natans]|uniref:F-box domain-containing protein n=1 Tax=Trapa natans TaxID=22666 RepID=A0AAN7MG33_TRANT|nr:hypothetical protein SAY86_001149 [Trapa natans]
MMLFLISCFSFVLLSNHLPFKLFKPNPGGFAFSALARLFFSEMRKLVPKLTRVLAKKVGDDEGNKMSLLDLPELTLECILERLPPSGLCQMGQVCASMRDMCRSDHLWERHFNRKWGRLVGDSAYRQWQCKVKSRKTEHSGCHHLRRERKCRWQSAWMRAIFGWEAKSRCSPLPVGSTMAWYLSLESGQLWFPAQVYNRENGHAGFLLSCYDADVSYDSKTNTFQARYPSQGRRMVEENIPWERLRAPPVDTQPLELHVSDCLGSLRPGDHIEVQWRKSKEFPYGWWYGVVGHLQSCSENEAHCCCLQNGEIVLTLNTYSYAQ